MRLTTQGYKCPLLEHYSTLLNDTAHRTDRLHYLLDHMGDFDRSRYQLLRTWGAKFQAVMSFKLNEVVLDLSAIYGSDGEFLEMDLEYLIIDARNVFAPDGEYLALETARECSWLKDRAFPV